MLSCVLICLLYVCMCIANPPACVTITHLLRGEEMPLLYNSVNTQVCNGFHDLLGGTQWFVFGSGAIDYMAKEQMTCWDLLCAVLPRQALPPASSGLQLAATLLSALFRV